MHIEETNINLEKVAAVDYKLEYAVYIYQKGIHSVCVLHKIKKCGEFGLGKPVDGEALSGLFVNNKKSNNIAILPEMLLVDNSQYAIWWSQKQQRRMFFRLSNQSVILPVIYPSLIWGVNKAKRSLHLAAISNIRPVTSSKTYHAPLMNVDGNGLVCQGTAQIPDLNNIEEPIMSEVESCIFDSNFTHVNHDGTLKGKMPITTRELFRYWKNKSKQNKAPLLSELSQYGTVAEFINGVRG